LGRITETEKEKEPRRKKIRKEQKKNKAWKRKKERNYEGRRGGQTDSERLSTGGWGKELTIPQHKGRFKTNGGGETAEFT